VGDTVEVAIDAAAMKVRKEVVAALKRGERLVVERLWGQWLWTTVEIAGVRKSGWVRIDQVRRVEPAQPPIAEGDQVAVVPESAPVRRQEKTIATLRRRYTFIVERARDDAVATTVDVEGKAVQGWVLKKHVRRLAPGQKLPIGAADQVVVTAETAAVKFAGHTIATLPKGYVFTVEATQDDLVATTVDVAGRARQGWVSLKRVRLATPKDLHVQVRRWRIHKERLCTIDVKKVLRESLVVSPDSWHIAYVERSAEGCRVVADGRPGPAHELIRRGTPLFAPQGRRLAYAALDDGRWRVIVDNFPGPGLERVAALTFSPDGRHVAYAAFKDRKWRVLRDGRPGPSLDDIDRDSLRFSPDGGHLAYAAKQWGKWSAVLDGKAGPEYDQVSGLLFSPDGRRFLYAARAGTRWHVVIDGQRGPAFEAVGERKFSADGRRAAYVARAEGQFRVVVDGFVGDGYDGIMEASPVFSPDGRRVAYAALRDGKAHVVLDGKAQRDYDGLAGLVFSPNSRRVAYAGRRGMLWHVVLDGREGLPYDAVAKGTPVFSPDSRRRAPRPALRRHRRRHAAFQPQQPPPRLRRHPRRQVARLRRWGARGGLRRDWRGGLQPRRPAHRLHGAQGQALARRARRRAGQRARRPRQGLPRGLHEQGWRSLPLLGAQGRQARSPPRRAHPEPLTCAPRHSRSSLPLSGAAPAARPRGWPFRTSLKSRAVHPEGSPER